MRNVSPALIIITKCMPCAVLVLSIGLCRAAVADTQAGYSEQIRALEAALAEINAAVAAGEKVRAEIERDLAALKDEVAQESDQPLAEPATTADATALAASVDESTADADLVAAAPATEVQRGMQGSINPLRESSNYLTGEDLLDESFSGSIPIFGSDWRFATRGYVKLDVIQDFDYVGDRFEFYVPSIPVDGDPDASLDGRSTFHAKESRIGFDFRKKVVNANGNEYPLQVFLELDFFDDREDFRLQPRMRHAYGVLGRVLGGQTWTTSADMIALAGTIDFDSGDALYGDRVSQIRWADRLNDTTTWAIALEENKSDIGNPLGFDGSNRADTPSLAGNVRWTRERAHLGLGYDIFGLDWQGGSTGPDDSTIGWGLALSGRYLLGDDARNALSGQLTVGEGSAFRVLSFSGAAAGAVLDPQGNIETLEHWQAYLAYNHYWSESLNSSFVFAHSFVDTTDYQDPSAIESVSTVHANLIWFPYNAVSTGVELMWGERENRDGASGDALRLQYMLKFKFN